KLQRHSRRPTEFLFGRDPLESFSLKGGSQPGHVLWSDQQAEIDRAAAIAVKTDGNIPNNRVVDVLACEQFVNAFGDFPKGFVFEHLISSLRRQRSLHLLRQP